jgi:hypothetical protein
MRSFSEELGVVCRIHHEQHLGSHKILPWVCGFIRGFILLRKDLTRNESAKKDKAFKIICNQNQSYSSLIGNTSIKARNTRPVNNDRAA